MASLSAGSIAAIVAVSQLSPDGKLTYAAVSLSIFFIFSFVSMLLAFRAAEPIDFDFLGNDPENWVDDIKRGLTFKDSLTHSAVHYSQQIKDNNKRMSENTKLLKIGIRLFFLGFIVSLAPILHRFLYSIQL
ncbi:hypothetical protein C3941_04535 [Kaistia algarum]|nr:hypothetical protein C3941_04535 [Kaistia algarum]